MIHTRFSTEATTAPNSAPAPAMRRNLGHLAADVVTLVELQAELLQVDLKECLRGFVTPIILSVVGIVCGLAALPVLLLCLAYFLVEATELSLVVSLLIAGGAGLLLAMLCAGIAVLLLKRDIRVLNRSATELRRNVRWLKEVLTASAPLSGHG